MQKLVQKLAVVTLLTACGSEADLGHSSNEIINGDLVTGDGYPTIGLMMAVANASRDGMPAKRQPLGLCTGTLISPTAVLLAAHCVDSMILNQSLSQAGITIEGEIEFRFTFENSVGVFIEKTPEGNVFHEPPELLVVERVDQMTINVLGSLFPPNKMDDIAVLHLAEKVKGHPVQQLATPADVNGMAAGTLHAVAGYGQTSNDPGDFNMDGMVDDPGASAGTLHSGKSKLNNLGVNELIAGNMDAQQACRGDSGGPIFVDESTDLQLGIASRINGFPSGGGPPRCEPGLVYTRVDAYRAWIESKVPDLGEATEPCAANDPAPSCAGGDDGGDSGDSGDSGDNTDSTDSADSTDSTDSADSSDSADGSDAEDNPADGDGDGNQDGGCSTTGHGAGWLGFLPLGVALVLARRRQRR